MASKPGGTAERQNGRTAERRVGLAGWPVAITGPLARFVLVFPVDVTGVTIPPEDRALAVSLVDQLGAALATAAEAP
jgi:hypothetical protein